VQVASLKSIVAASSSPQLRWFCETAPPFEVATVMTIAAAAPPFEVATVMTIAAVSSTP